MAIVQSEGLSQRKIPMTSSGIELATFQVVEQGLKPTADIAYPRS